jgi:hypothetical protein
MFHRKDAVTLAVVGLLASCGLAMADSTGVSSPALSLEPTVVTAQDSAPTAPLMMGLDKIGAAKPLTNLGINIYGWVEGGYDANLRNNAGSKNATGVFPGQSITRPRGFTNEFGNHFQLDQVAIRIERVVDSKKFDVGGLIEANFGTDDNFTTPAGANNGSTTSGWELQTPGDNPGEVPHIDFTQAYVAVNIPVGNGLKIVGGRFYAVLGYEGYDPRGNAFYSKSQIYNVEPLVNTGVIGYYTLNDQWSFAGGVTRGFNQNTEDNNGSPDGIMQVTYTPNKQWTFILNAEVGPQDTADTSHYDTMIDPIVAWQVTDKLKLAGEGIYQYDGGLNGGGGTTHAYGDNYGVALYGNYVLNDYLTLNARAEWLHTYQGAAFNGTGVLAGGGSVPTLNVYEVTAGVTITPLPKDPIGMNLSIRPEVRYDFSEDHLFVVGAPTAAYRDQWSVGADVIFKF